MPLRIALLASGSGSNAQRIFDLRKTGALDADPVLLVCNRPGAPVLERAARAGAPVLLLDHMLEPDRERYDRKVVAALRDAGAELIVLAGYMRLLTPFFVRAFPGRIINLHPALLPAFPGLHGARDALDYGVRLTGCTVHFVDEEMDHGQVIIQAALPVNPDDTRESLQQRIHGMEHRIYPQAVQWFAQGRVRVEGRSVRIVPDPASRPAATEPDRLVWPPLEEPF